MRIWSVTHGHGDEQVSGSSIQNKSGANSPELGWTGLYSSEIRSFIRGGDVIKRRHRLFCLAPNMFSRDKTDKIRGT